MMKHAALLAGFALICSGCSLKSAVEEAGHSGLAINIARPNSRAQLDLMNFLGLNLPMKRQTPHAMNKPKHRKMSGSSGVNKIFNSNFASLSMPVISTPAAASDFDCYGINVTGPNISATEDIGNCIVHDNFAGKGQGILAGLVPYGQSIEIEVPAGKDRRVDVYGFFPPPSYCFDDPTLDDVPASQKGYLVGTASVDISEATSVTVNTAFSQGAASSFTCTNDSITMNPASSYYGHIAYSDNTQSVLPTSSPNIFPTPVVTSNFVNVDATRVSSDSKFEETCGVAKFSMHYFYFNVSQLKVSDFNNLEVDWNGSGGTGITGGCPGGVTAITAGFVNIAIWDENTAGWVNLGSTTPSNLTHENIFAYLTNPVDYTVNISGTNYIVFRAATNGIGAGTADLQTDQAQIRLYK